MFVILSTYEGAPNPLGTHDSGVLDRMQEVKGQYAVHNNPVCECGACHKLRFYIYSL